MNPFNGLPDLKQLAGAKEAAYRGTCAEYGLSYEAVKFIFDQYEERLTRLAQAYQRGSTKALMALQHDLMAEKQKEMTDGAG